jgi:hypothetical protein
MVLPVEKIAKPITESKVQTMPTAPRALYRTATKALIMVATKAMAKGGTVYSCVLLAEYPNPATIEGVKYARPKRETPLPNNTRTTSHMLVSLRMLKICLGIIAILFVPLASSNRCWTRHCRSVGERVLTSSGLLGRIQKLKREKQMVKTLSSRNIHCIYSQKTSHISVSRRWNFNYLPPMHSPQPFHLLDSGSQKARKCT